MRKKSWLKRSFSFAKTPAMCRSRNGRLPSRLLRSSSRLLPLSYQSIRARASGFLKLARVSAQSRLVRCAFASNLLPAIYQRASRPWSNLVPGRISVSKESNSFFQELPGLRPKSTLTNELSCMNIDVLPSVWLHSVAAWRSSDVLRRSDRST
jgi:hypothetical protein